MKPKYSRATLHLQEQNQTSQPPYSHGPDNPFDAFRQNRVAFLWKGNLVQAWFESVLPVAVLADSTTALTKYVGPIVYEVATDLGNIEKLLGDIKDLARKGFVNYSLTYRKEPFPPPNTFRVYDYAKVEDTFGWLLRIKEEQPSLPRNYRRLLKLSTLVQQDREGSANVDGKTLEEAVEKTLKIYNTLIKISPKR